MEKEALFSHKVLKNRKLKLTPTRVDLLEYMNDYKTAVPASSIQKEFINNDRVTLYRTIQTLLEKGIIHKAYVNSEETYYALCGTNCTSHKHIHNHVHFKCISCEAVTCEHLSKEVEIVLPDFNIQQISINLTGLCKSCQA